MATFSEILTQNLVNNISGTSPLVPGMQGGHGGNELTTPSAAAQLGAGSLNEFTPPGVSLSTLPQLNSGGDVGNSQPTESAFAPAHKFTYNEKLADPYAMVPVASTNWKDLWKTQLAGYGISEIPAWMQVYGDPKSNQWERSNLAEGIQRALSIDPFVWLDADGKRREAMHNAGIFKSKNNKLYGGRFNQEEIAWTPETKATVQQAYLHRLLKENHGGFNPLGEEMAGLGIVLAPIALATGAWAAGPPAAGAVGAAEGAGVVGAEGAAAGAGAAGLGGATAAGAGEYAAVSGPSSLWSVGTAGAGLGGSAEAAFAAPASLWSVGMGPAIGAAWLGELGSLISGGADLFSGMDIGKLIGNGINLGNLIGGGTPGGIIAAPTTIQGGSTSAPQTSQIIPGGPTFNPQSVITPAAMPTSSIMGAFGNSDTKEPDYLKYFTSLF